jgi:tRNA(Ile)-lysidine synthase
MYAEYKDSQQLFPKLQINLLDILGSLQHSFFRKIGIAVSGGSDSIALLNLMHNYSKLYNIEVFVFSVDHNLRPESQEEVEHVYNISKSMKINCIKLKWLEPAKVNILANAREARYDLISEAAKKIGIKLVLTAHHQDDYEENYQIRSIRKSGSLGLVPSYFYFHKNVMFGRPLFNFRKYELQNYLIENNIKWFEDPSNHDPKYLRSIIRLANKSKYLTFDNYDNVIPEKLIREIAKRCSISNYGFATIKIPNQLESLEIELYLLNFILAIISGKNQTPRARSTLPLLNLIKNNENFVRTLHGCIIKKV